MRSSGRDKLTRVSPWNHPTLLAIWRQFMALFVCHCCFFRSSRWPSVVQVVLRPIDSSTVPQLLACLHIHDINGSCKLFSEIAGQAAKQVEEQRCCLGQCQRFSQCPRSLLPLPLLLLINSKHCLKGIFGAGPTNFTWLSEGERLKPY